MIDPHCPICHVRSEMVVGPDQAFCTDPECPVMCFNPSDPEPDVSKYHRVDLKGLVPDGW